MVKRDTEGRAAVPDHTATLPSAVPGLLQRGSIPRPLPHPHTLKHSVAMELVKKVGIQDLRQFIRHKSLNSTGMYFTGQQSGSKCGCRESHGLLKRLDQLQQVTLGRVSENDNQRLL